ncbi:DUF736 family protein [Sphingobium sp. CR28]|uniref:DUF736 family protein n=1 Tax=Sphingobium sp. CR28 TaxID=3400272 RepID=UPI003FF07F95
MARETRRGPVAEIRRCDSRRWKQRPDRDHSQHPQGEGSRARLPIISRKNGLELGAGWIKSSQTAGADYISVVLSAPEWYSLPVKLPLIQ